MYYRRGLCDRRLIHFNPRTITSRETANSYLIARVQDLGGFVMDAANWNQSEHRARQWSSLEARQLRIRLMERIALTLIVAVAIALLSCATLALVGIDCPMRDISHGWV
jgi:hypothetical protein